MFQFESIEQRRLLAAGPVEANSGPQRLSKVVVAGCSNRRTDTTTGTTELLRSKLPQCGGIELVVGESTCMNRQWG